MHRATRQTYRARYARRANYGCRKSREVDLYYHAYWVHPDWVNEMKKVYKLGVHTFYRPRAWGDGDDEPTWGDAATTEKEAANEEAKGPVSHSLEWLKSEEGQASLRQNAHK